LEELRRAAKELKTVQIQYVNQKGEISVRETEPYEIRDGKYWGFCVEKGSIRQFNLERIREAHTTNFRFKPRWPVQII
jgi:predicted DNA-binding transcriptional regulator YafY